MAGNPVNHDETLRRSTAILRRSTFEPPTHEHCDQSVETETPKIAVQCAPIPHSTSTRLSDPAPGTRRSPVRISPLTDELGALSWAYRIALHYGRRSPQSLVVIYWISRHSRSWP